MFGEPDQWPERQGSDHDPPKFIIIICHLWGPLMKTTCRIYHILWSLIPSEENIKLSLKGPVAQDFRPLVFCVHGHQMTTVVIP
jgi:hypothetical protein